MIYKNDVYQGEYFYYTSRTKSSESIEEKLFRKSELLYDLLEVELDDIINYSEEDKKRIKKKIFSFEDIVGVRYVTELNNDAESIFHLIRDSQTSFLERGINFKNIDNPKKKMNNGLSIYNIKGTYSTNFVGPLLLGEERPEKVIGIELQIKSQLETAWGDLEHKSFYKNHIISPVTDLSKTSVNHIGKLLNEIDHFLYSVRISEKKYIDEKDNIVLKEILNNTFLPEAKKRIHNKYNLYAYNHLVVSFFNSHYSKSKFLEFANIDQEKIAENWNEVQKQEGQLGFLAVLKKKSLHLEFIETIFYTLRMNEEVSLTWSSKEFLTLIWNTIYHSHQVNLSSGEEIKKEEFSNNIYNILETHVDSVDLKESDLIDSTSYTDLINIFNSIYDDLIQEENEQLNFGGIEEYPTSKEIAYELLKIAVCIKFIEIDKIPFAYSLDHVGLVDSISGKLQGITLTKEFIRTFTHLVDEYQKRIDDEKIGED